MTFADRLIYVVRSRDERGRMRYSVNWKLKFGPSNDFAPLNLLSGSKDFDTKAERDQWVKKFKTHTFKVPDGYGGSGEIYGHEFELKKIDRTWETIDSLAALEKP